MYLSKEVADADFDLNRAIDKIEARLLLKAERKGGWKRPLDQILALIAMKEEILVQMGHIDPHPFWDANRNFLIGDAILTRRGWEYDLVTLQKRLASLTERKTQSPFFCELQELRGRHSKMQF